jgi:hypothetical protein
MRQISKSLGALNTAKLPPINGPIPSGRTLPSVGSPPTGWVATVVQKPMRAGGSRSLFGQPGQTQRRDKKFANIRRLG